ncbi:MAG: pyridoxamine 5'-phosphate oxidase family protein [Ferruginibacter sp.]|nr:pyridoxamine 5'-phosphate oxidase family protein [Cytophagales bacterium]
METQQNSLQENVKKLVEKIKDIKIAMLSTSDETGRTHSRPMYTHEVEEDGTVWFFTGKDSRKSREISRNTNVSLNYSDPKTDRYVSVSGTAVLSDDQNKINDLWKPILKAWFPGGKEDPTIQLIRVEPEEAEYWDTPDSNVVQLIGFVKSVVTGKPYRPGENEKLDL